MHDFTVIITVMTDEKGRLYSFIAIHIEFSERENNRIILKPSWSKCIRG